MNELKDLLIRNRKFLLGVFIVGVLCCFFLGNSILNLIDNKREQRRLTKLSAQLDKEYEQLHAQLELLKAQDPAYIERIARTQYNMAAPDETEYRFNPK